jgi:hypothetical protein
MYRYFDHWLNVLGQNGNEKFKKKVMSVTRLSNFPECISFRLTDAMVAETEGSNLMPRLYIGLRS